MLRGLDAGKMLDAAARASGAAIALRIAGEERWVAAEDAGLYRDALGAVPPGGLPEAFLEDVPDALARARAPLRAHARAVHDRRSCATRYGIDPTRRAARARARRRPRARRAAAGRHRARVVRPRGAAPAAPRVARRAAQGDRARRPARARALPAELAGRRPPPGRPAPGVDRLREVARAAPGPRARARGLGARRAAAARRRLLAGVARPAVRLAARWSGSARARSGAAPDAWPCTSATTCASSARRRSRATRRPSPRTRRSASGCAAGAALLHRPARRRASSRPRSSRRRCGTSSGRAR